MRALSLITLLFTAGSILLHLFVVLGGAKDHGVLRKFWWLQADTSGFPNASPISEWTFYGLCNRDENGQELPCGKKHADYPIDPYNQFGKSDQVPAPFKDHRKAFYYETRFAFPFYLIALFFELLVLLVSLGALCSRIVGFVASFLTLIAFVFAAAGAALSTVAAVKGRKAFRDAGRKADLGKYNLGFVWATVFMLAVNTLLFCCVSPRKSHNSAAAGGAGGYSSNKKSKGKYSSNNNNNEGGVYRFGFGSKKTNEGGVANNANNNGDASSFVRAV